MPHTHTTLLHPIIRRTSATQNNSRKPLRQQLATHVSQARVIMNGILSTRLRRYPGSPWRFRNRAPHRFQQPWLQSRRQGRQGWTSIHMRQDRWRPGGRCSPKAPRLGNPVERSVQPRLYWPEYKAERDADGCFIFPCCFPRLFNAPKTLALGVSVHGPCCFWCLWDVGCRQ